eukprot:scaffold2288_cov258-Pinguiococcus_pyrenoidosus.AAC.7
MFLEGLESPSTTSICGHLGQVYSSGNWALPVRCDTIPQLARVLHTWCSSSGKTTCIPSVPGRRRRLGSSSKQASLTFLGFAFARRVPSIERGADSIPARGRFQSAPRQAVRETARERFLFERAGLAGDALMQCHGNSDGRQNGLAADQWERRPATEEVNRPHSIDAGGEK